MILVVISIIALIVISIIYFTAPQPCATVYQRSDGNFAYATGEILTKQEVEALKKSGCPMPRITTQPTPGPGSTLDTEAPYAKTPIYKVEDYDLSRVIGTEKSGHMVLERDQYNELMFNRYVDWADMPYSSEERSRILPPRGHIEGFTATGELTTQETEVARAVAEAYKDEKDYEPVVTRIGKNNWEVSELKPKRVSEIPVEEPVNQNRQPEVDVRFRHRESEVVNNSLAPYFHTKMERMYGPSVDRESWVM